MSEFKVVDISTIENEQLVNELALIQKEQHDQALKNLITGITPTEEFEKGEIPRRKGRGGKFFPYLPNWWFIREANAVFNRAWDFEIEDVKIFGPPGKEKQASVQGRVTVKIPGQKITRTYSDGTVEVIEIEGLTLSKSQFGSTDIKQLKDGSGPVSIGDDLKGAATDSMKKSLSQFGFGADVYGMREGDEDSAEAQEERQNSAVLKIMEDKGITEEQVEELSMKLFGKPSTELPNTKTLQLINELRKLEV